MKNWRYPAAGSVEKTRSFKLRDFAKREDGTFTIFVVFLFVTMLLVTGTSVDMMNLERDRANLQATLDRAVLAAADLDQRETPKAVVEAYLEKAGMRDNLKDVRVNQTFGSKKVWATANVDVPTNFMKLAGIETLSAIATSEAEESVEVVEISLVLDISGSMGWQSAEAGVSKIDVLKESATKFVSLMLDKEEDTKISISLIPYAAQVNAGEMMLGKFTNVSQEHNFSHCVNFTSNHFNNAKLRRGLQLDRAAHFDPFSYSEGTITSPVCPVRTGSAITPMTDNITKLHDRIDQLSPKGNTSIDVGMKWAVGLLDPTTRGVIRRLSTENDVQYPEVVLDEDGNPKLDGNDNPITQPTKIVPARFNNRPLDYDADVAKVVIVMTDGENTTQYMLDPSLRDGLSDVWYNPDSGRTTNWRYWINTRNGGYWSSTRQTYGDYSVFRPDNDPDYYWTQRNDYRDHPYGNPDPETASNEEQGTAVRLTYPELFNRTSLRWNADFNYGWKDDAYTDWVSNAYSGINATDKDTRLKNVCDAAKKEGVVIFGIAFEAPTNGLEAIENCASSSSHVYDVDGLELERAFASIASSIRKLRLTQ